MTDSGIIARRLELPDAYRRVSLVFRQSFPRRKVLDVFVNTVLEHLPNTVRALPYKTA
jgi:LysR family hydrogen peroxide-inducible transcriptional activator